MKKTLFLFIACIVNILSYSQTKPEDIKVENGVYSILVESNVPSIVKFANAKYSLDVVWVSEYDQACGIGRVIGKMGAVNEGENHKLVYNVIIDVVPESFRIEVRGFRYEWPNENKKFSSSYAEKKEISKTINSIIQIIKRYSEF